MASAREIERVSFSPLSSREAEALSVRFEATGGRSLVVRTQARDEGVVFYEEETSDRITSTRAGLVKRDSSGVWRVVYFDPGGVAHSEFTRGGQDLSAFFGRPVELLSEEEAESALSQTAPQAGSE